MFYIPNSTNTGQHLENVICSISQAKLNAINSKAKHQPDAASAQSNTIAKRSKVNCSINWILTATSSRQARTTADEQDKKQNHSIPQQQAQ